MTLVARMLPPLSHESRAFLSQSMGASFVHADDLQRFLRAETSVCSLPTAVLERYMSNKNELQPRPTGNCIVQ